MVHRRLSPPVSAAAAVVAAVLLAGCAPSDTTGATPTPTPAITSAPSPSPTSTSEERVALITLDGTSVDGAPLVAYDDPDALIDTLSDLLGSAPEESQVEGPYSTVWTAYDWATVRALLTGTRITLTVSGDAPGVVFTTEQGIGIGSTRAEAMAAGAEDEWDEDGDGIADYLKLGMREAPGTQSLSNPGAVGVEFLTLKVTDDVITSVSSGGNDFSDI